MKYLNHGQPAAPEKILDQREARGQWIETAALQFPTDTLICFKLNIPGPIKNNRLIGLVFAAGCRQISAMLGPQVILKETAADTGPEILLRTGLAAKSVKEKMIQLEETSRLGRLYDIDVFSQGLAVSREELALSERKCLICSNSAKICSRSQAHELEELLEIIETIMLTDPAIRAAIKGPEPADPYDE